MLVEALMFGSYLPCSFSFDRSGVGANHLLGSETTDAVYIAFDPVTAPHYGQHMHLTTPKAINTIHNKS